MVGRRVVAKANERAVMLAACLVGLWVALWVGTWDIWLVAQLVGLMVG